MEDLDKLPLPLLIAMGFGLAVILAVRYFGLMSGERATPEKSGASAQVAAVIVDPTALNRLTATAEALNMTIMDLVASIKEKTRVDNMMTTEIDSLREEIRIQRELMRNRR